jgi:hypothetical protein
MPVGFKFRTKIDIPLNFGSIEGPLSINVKKAIKTRGFMAFFGFILRGPFFLCGLRNRLLLYLFFQNCQLCYNFDGWITR